MSSPAVVQQTTGSVSGSLQIEPVAITDRKAIREMILFPFKLYKGDPNWVPQLIGEREDFISSTKNPFFEHARVQFFFARRNGELVGTICACVNDNHNKFHSEKAGSFGFFECTEDASVATALFKNAEDWVRSQGMTIMRGPMNFSSNDEWGLLIDGFHEPPMVLMTYNKPYYSRMIEDYGYIKAMDLFAYVADIDTKVKSAPPKVFRAAEKAAARQGIRVRKGKISEFENEARIVMEVTNRVWSKNWGFVPITDHEAEHLGKSLKPVIDPDLVLIAETAEGEPIGVSFTLPDFHQALKWSGGGRMFPFGILKFLWYKRKITQIRLVLMGVAEEYRSLGLDAIFYVETTRIALEKGYTRIEGSWILEVNTMMNRIVQRLGGQKYKTYRIYEKTL